MKILYFRLMGYGGIYQGMGRNEIVIPFSELRNNIILIQGKNGTGKSTVLSALSLDPDKSEMYRRDTFYNPVSGEVTNIDYPAEKEIHVVCEGDLYKILIVSTVKNQVRQTTKAYIQKNGEELNANGNVTSFKSIRDMEFNVDPNYMELSMISSEDRGLVDKSPSQRKAFMSSVLDSLSFYNNCYKAVSKKASMYTSQMDNIKSKIYNIGDRDNIYNAMISAQQRMEQVTAEKDSIMKAIADCEVTIRMIDPDGKIQDIYQSIVVELEAINSKISKYSDEYNRFYTLYSKTHQNNDFKSEKQLIQENLNKVSYDIETMRSQITSYLESINDLNTQVEITNAKILQLQSDTIQDSIEDIVKELQDKISLYHDIIDNSISFDRSLTKSEAEIAKGILTTIKENINILWGNDHSILGSAMGIKQESDFKHMLQETRDRMEQLKSDLYQYRNEIDTKQSKLSLSDVLKSRPGTCTVDDCPFIKEALSYNFQSVQKEIEESNQLMKDAEEELKLLNIEYESYIEIYTLYQYYQSTIETLILQNNSILSKLGPTFNHITDIQLLRSSIYDHYNFNELNEIDECIGIIDLMNECAKLENDMVGYNADLKIYRNNKAMVDLLQSDLSSKKNEIATIQSNMAQLEKNINFSNEVITGYNKNLTLLDQLILSETALNEAKEEKRILGDRFQLVKDDIKKVQEKVDRLRILNESLTLNKNELIPVSEAIEKAKYQLIRLDSYYEDMEKYSKLYERTNVVKDACSPTKTGIQRLFISFYFMKTITIANDLLSFLFDGHLQLSKPIINQNEFRIPFINEHGNTIKDISVGSTSQKCMFGMAIGFALLHQGSKKYNILRLDEIDGGLDTTNRFQFIPALRYLMEVMEVEQCITISHNMMEAESTGTDIIQLSENGIYLNNVKVA